MHDQDGHFAARQAALTCKPRQITRYTLQVERPASLARYIAMSAA